MALPGFDSRRFPVVTPPAGDAITDDFTGTNGVAVASRGPWDNTGYFQGTPFVIDANRGRTNYGGTENDVAFVRSTALVPPLPVEQYAGLTVISRTVPAGATGLTIGPTINGDGNFNAMILLADFVTEQIGYSFDFTRQQMQSFAALEAAYPALDFSGSFTMEIRRLANAEHQVFIDGIRITELDRADGSATVGFPGIFSEALADNGEVIFDNFYAGATP